MEHRVRIELTNAGLQAAASTIWLSVCKVVGLPRLELEIKRS